MVRGQVITTTAEHPFYVAGEAPFVPAGELTLEDQLVDSQGRPIAIDAIRVTDRLITVYNLRVADFHTYFVGCDEWGFSIWAHNADCGVDRKVHKFADGAEADSIVVVYRFKKGDLTPAQRQELGHKFGKANQLLASGDEVAHVPAAGAAPSNNLRNARRQFVRDTDAPIDPATGRLVPKHKIKNPPGVQVDEYVGVAWGGQARNSNQHYLDTSTNHMLGGKDKAILQQLRADGLAGVRVRKFRLIFED